MCSKDGECENQRIESDSFHVVAEKAALMSENIVKMLMTSESIKLVSSSPPRGDLDGYLRGETSQCWR